MPILYSSTVHVGVRLGAFRRLFYLVRFLMPLREHYVCCVNSFNSLSWLLPLSLLKFLQVSLDFRGFVVSEVEFQLLFFIHLCGGFLLFRGVCQHCLHPIVSNRLDQAGFI